jgi:hypothetical protein
MPERDPCLERIEAPYAFEKESTLSPLLSTSSLMLKLAERLFGDR